VNRTRSLALVLTAAVAAAAALATSAWSRPAAATLTGTVGPGFTISLTQGGKKVKTLKAGTYTLVVTDKAAIHNFVIEEEHGGTFEKTVTSVPFTGTKTVTVKLTKGSWKVYCKPHESVMFQDFSVS
jgi:spore coat protein U-like protein